MRMPFVSPMTERGGERGGDSLHYLVGEMEVRVRKKRKENKQEKIQSNCA